MKANEEMFWIRYSHYKWLEIHLPSFFWNCGVPWQGNEGIITAHGDKCYSYRQKWLQAGIPFEHGVAVYLLTYCLPYSKEVRDTEKGWVAPNDWVEKHYYERFSALLAKPFPVDLVSLISKEE
jgi:hypothetical protein